jgi:Na+-transporting NADH:ubiquinone oxidoreductase subunit NqrB
MSIVVIALMPALFFGMYNIGYQNFKAAGTLADATFWPIFFYGFLAVLPKIIVSYIVGLGIEFAWALVLSLVLRRRYWLGLRTSLTNLLISTSKKTMVFQKTLFF